MDIWRTRIIEILKDNNWYGVIWDGHFGRYFKIVKLSLRDGMTNEIYSAIYESFDYLVEDDEIVGTISFDYDDSMSWAELYDKFMKWLPMRYCLEK